MRNRSLLENGLTVWKLRFSMGKLPHPPPGWMVGGIADQPHGGEFNKGDFLFSYRIPGVRVNQG